MEVFGSGPRLDAPRGDTGRQAVASLRGYAYQLYVSALAWLALGDGEMLYLEVAEDYATASRGVLDGVQVKDTAPSGSVTLRSEGVRKAIDAYVDLMRRNPDRRVTLRYLTTSRAALEQQKKHRHAEGPALLYWRRAAAGADLAALRALVADLDLAADTKAYLSGLSDDDYRKAFLQRVHWDCGAPDLADVRSDLEAGLVEYAATTRRLSSHAARALTPTVAEKVLLTAVRDGPRALRRADLLQLIDDASLVAVPVQQLASAFQGNGYQMATDRPPLLNPASDIPMPAIYAPRETLMTAIDQARRNCGLAIVHGATGLGKSLAARMAAAQTEAAWSIADLRNLSAAESAARLGYIQAELATSPSPHVILDDLNDFDEPAVRDGLARLLASLRRRDGTAIVTSYRPPAKTTLQQLTNDPADPIEAPYFEEAEVADLVVATGGESKYGGPVYRAAANGHPHLTMAALLHLQSSAWSRRSVASILGGDMQSELDVERRAIRQRFVHAMDLDAQTLLLRTSLIRDGFDRDLALAVASIEPSVPRGGLVLDQLLGPWIEPYRRNRLRVSPLLNDAATDVFSPAECRAVHRRVAETLMRGGTVEPLDASALMHHALRSEVSALVVGFAHSVMTCNSETLELLSPFLVDLAFLDTDKPIFSLDPSASAMMRLAQLLALLPHGTADRARACWDALEREREEVKGPDLFEGLMLSKVLVQQRTGALFDDWIDLVLRFDRVCLAVPKLSENARSLGSGGAPHATGVMLASQMRNIRNVAQFRELLERLDREDAETRARLFSSFRPDRGDISILVNHGWLIESRTENFDWETAQREYGAAADIAMRWGDRLLASRCYIAQSICIDENGGDADRALAALAAAQDRVGFDIAISRARAKIFWRARNHEAALPLLEAAAQVGGQTALERAYIAREAGISAANLGDWSAAVNWFDRAQRAATEASALPMVRAMSVGLLADTGQAAWHAGRPDLTVGKMREALVALPTIDQDGTLEEAHCHRVVRHGLLWLYHQVTGDAPGFDEEIVYAPGASSNPEPNEAIRGHPVVSLDISFYLLAEIDRALPEPTGYHLVFRDDLLGGPILGSEISTAIDEDHRALLTRDPNNIVMRLRREGAMAALMKDGGIRRVGFDVFNPKRGEIPLPVIDADAPEAVYRGAEDYLLSFAIAAALSRAFDIIDIITAEGLAAPEISGLHPLLERMSGHSSPPTNDREGAANALWRLRQDVSVEPAELCWSGTWLLLHVDNSLLRKGVEEPLIAWIFAAVDHLVRHARFRLFSPATTAGPIEALIAAPGRDRAAAAGLLLALAPAAPTSLLSEVRARLDKIAGTSSAGGSVGL